MLMFGIYYLYQFSDKALKIENLSIGRNEMGCTKTFSKIFLIGGKLENGSAISNIDSYEYDEMNMIFTKNVSYLERARYNFLSLESNGKYKALFSFHFHKTFFFFLEFI